MVLKSLEVFPTCSKKERVNKIFLRNCCIQFLEIHQTEHALTAAISRICLLQLVPTLQACLTPFCLKRVDTRIQLPLIPEKCPAHQRRQPPCLQWKLGQPWAGGKAQQPHKHVLTSQEWLAQGAGKWEEEKFTWS